MTRRSSPARWPSAEQLPLEPPPKKPPRAAPDPERAAKIAVAHRTKASSVPGHVRFTLTLEMTRALAERLSARAIRDGKNLEAVVIELLEAGTKR